MELLVNSVFQLYLHPHFIILFNLQGKFAQSEGGHIWLFAFTHALHLHSDRGISAVHVGAAAAHRIGTQDKTWEQETFVNGRR